jgi:hypothetical protein
MLVVFLFAGGIALQPSSSLKGVKSSMTSYGTGTTETDLVASEVLSPTAMALAVATAAKESKDMDEYAALASATMEAQGQDRGRSAQSTLNTRSRLFSMAPHLAADLDEAAIAKRVRVPTVSHFISAALKDARSEWKSSYICIIAVFVTSICCIGGLIGGMVDLQVQGQCGLLARQVVSSTYSVQPPLGVDQYASVVVDNQWPRGSVEIVADRFILGTGSHQVRMNSFS